MNTLLTIILVVVGVALLVVELFFIPGFGLAGVAGFLSVAGGVCYAYLKMGDLAGHITLACSVLLCAIAVYVFIKSKTLDKLSLKKNVDSKVDLISDTDVKVADTGETISRLAPMGKVRIGGKDYEAKSQSDFIDEKTMVVVVAIEGNKLIVDRDK